MTLLLRHSILLSFLSFISLGCVQQIAIRTVGGIIDEYGFATLNEEGDLPLAEQSIASNLKLLEILAKGDPRNREILSTLSMGYASYALGFVEDDDAARARIFYLRGRDFGLRILKENNRFAEALDGDMLKFQTSLQSLSTGDVPVVFWTAVGWGGYINLSISDPEAIVDIPKVEAMIQFVADRDSNYFYGGADLFLGTFKASRSKLLGGDPEAARNHFEKCLRINHGNFLLALVFYAKWYSVQMQDQELFQQLLTRVENASPDILPEARLTNAIAKKKARLLLARMNELF